MVNNGTFWYGTPNHFFHDNDMFIYIPGVVYMWMVWAVNMDIATLGYVKTALPI